jgi:hypothetical protein
MFPDKREATCLFNLNRNELRSRNLGSTYRREKGIDFINRRISKARERLAVLNSENNSIDHDEIWEAFFDIEEAILMTRVVFEDFDRPGKLRKLPTIGSSNGAIRGALLMADSGLKLAQTKLGERSGNESLRSLREARDQLKAALSAGKKIATKTDLRIA